MHGSSLSRSTGSIKGDPANKGRLFDILDKFLSLGDDKYISGHRHLVDDVHEAGARIGLQILHRGRNDVGSAANILFGVPSPWTR
jgi:2,4-dienoyl-CoA reductase-like NADH-dependent reductase (Old Yellow Enzyme family)